MRREALMRLFAIFVIGTSCFGQSPVSSLPFSPTAQSQTEKPNAPVNSDSAPMLPSMPGVSAAPNRAAPPSTGAGATRLLDVCVCPPEGCGPVCEFSNCCPPHAAERTDSLPEFPQATSLGWLGSSSTDQDAGERSEAQFVPPTFSIEPNAGLRWHTLDSKFITLQALSTMALIADAETTLRGLKQNPEATELNPLFGRHPTPARLFGIAVPLQVFNICFSYHLKKIAPRRSDWKFVPKLSITVHSIAAANNLAVTR
jgi:hypothetical protein